MNTNETTLGHYGQWVAVVIWVILFGVFLLFTPFYKKSQRRPSGVYLAFIIAMAFEMFGVPMSMYILSWVLGKAIPEGVFWGHTLINQIGYTGLYLAYAFFATGVLLVVLGWKEVFRRYWSKETGKGELVTNGIYRFIRHPQYTGFMLITLGMLCEWATIPLLIMWPILTVLYYKLAKREEAEMEQQFGEAYRQYRSRTGMFLPRLFPARLSTEPVR
jgi:protein-S-isoprenylcysteine O-methyltransferase Ste14